MSLAAASPAPATENLAPVAAGWTMIKYPGPQPGCTGVGYEGSVYYDRLDCGFGYVSVSETTLTGANASEVTVSFIDAGRRHTQRPDRDAADGRQRLAVQHHAGVELAGRPVTVRVTEVDPDGAGPAPNQVGNFGETSLFLNQLGASLGVLPNRGRGVQAGRPRARAGPTYEIDQIPPLAAPQETNVAATFRLRVVLPDGTSRGPFGPYTAGLNGAFTATSRFRNAGTDRGREHGLRDRARHRFGAGDLYGSCNRSLGRRPRRLDAARDGVPPTTLVVDNSFVSAVGWVKPGETYPFRVFVKNYTRLRRSAPRSRSRRRRDGLHACYGGSGVGIATFTPGSVTLDVGSVPARTAAGPTVKTLIVEARARTLGEDAHVVWKNISTTASLTYTGARR